MAREECFHERVGIKNKIRCQNKKRNKNLIFSLTPSLPARRKRVYEGVYIPTGWVIYREIYLYIFFSLGYIPPPLFFYKNSELLKRRSGIYITVFGGFARYIRGKDEVKIE